MKITTKVVYDMETLAKKTEEFYEYKGPIAKCSGSSGGSSGAVDFPEYMKEIHEFWLTSTAGTDTIDGSINEAIDGAYNNSPWDTASAYDPTTPLSNIDTALSDFSTILSGLDDEVDWDNFYNQAASSMAAPTAVGLITAPPDVVNIGSPTNVSDIADTTDVSTITDTAIDADSDSLSDLLDDELIAKHLPRFRGGMRDAHANANAMFTLGESLLEAFKLRDVAKHNSALRVQAALKNPDIELENEKLHHDVRKFNANISLENEKLDLQADIANADIDYKNRELELRTEENNTKVNIANAQNELQFEQAKIKGVDQMIRLMVERIGWEQSYLHLYIEGKRINIVANKEQTDMDNKIDEKDALWNLNIWKAGVNVMASISGATISQGEEPSPLQSALGGALSGVAAMSAAGATSGLSLAAGGVLGAAASLL